MSHNEIVLWSEIALVAVALVSLAVVYLTTRHKKHPR